MWCLAYEGTAALALFARSRFLALCAFALYAFALYAFALY
jgi:hypothetical protein